MFIQKGAGGEPAFAEHHSAPVDAQYFLEGTTFHLRVFQDCGSEMLGILLRVTRWEGAKGSRSSLHLWVSSPVSCHVLIT